MKGYDDQRWREAAETLGLSLWNARGKKVNNAKGTRVNEMRGTLDGFRVRARYGLQDVDDKITVIEVTLNRPLMLGFTYRVTTPPRDYRGRRMGAKHIDVLGVERARVRRMVDETANGARFASLADRYGEMGWVEVDDMKVCAHLELHTDLAEGYSPLLRTAVQLAALVEKARAEIDPAPWESELATNLAQAADALRLKLDPRRFRLQGAIRGMPTALQLETRDVYALRGQLGLGSSLPSGAKISPRMSTWSRLAFRLGFDRPSGNAQFDSLFQVTDSLRDRLSPAVTEALVALSSNGCVRVESDAIVFRSNNLTLDISHLLQWLATTAEQLMGPRATTPYRD